MSQYVKNFGIQAANLGSTLKSERPILFRISEELEHYRRLNTKPASVILMNPGTRLDLEVELLSNQNLPIGAAIITLDLVRIISTTDIPKDKFEVY